MCMAAAAVKVSYGPPPEGVTPVYTIADAIEHQSFFEAAPFSTRHDLEHGPPVEAALAAPGLVTVSGEFKMGGQEHFYLETNASRIVPLDSDESPATPPGARHRIKRGYVVSGGE